MPSLQIAVAPTYVGVDVRTSDAEASAETAGPTITVPARAMPAAIRETLLNIIPPPLEVRIVTSIAILHKREAESLTKSSILL